MTINLWLAGAALASVPVAVAAQTTPPEPAPEPTEDGIIVTATRTPALLSDTPVAATVLDEDFIRDARIDSLRQIDDYIPNVQFNQTGQVGGTYVTIRGIESNPFIVNRAAVYVDGIPFRELREQTLGTVEQIEVLRGPQGTLYGANTESGLIVIRTRQPSDAFKGEVTGSGFGFGNGIGGDVRLSVGGPVIADQLTASLVASYSHADSFVRNIAYSIGEEGQLSEAFVQGKLRWTPSAAVTLDVIAQASQRRAPGFTSRSSCRSTAPSTIATIPLPSTAGGERGGSR